jgi:hypothetical protein
MLRKEHPIGESNGGFLKYAMQMEIMLSIKV